MHAFQRQNSDQTLAQGVEEYFAAHPGLAQGRLMSPEALEFFRCHDVVRVVYRCGVALDDEAIVKIASILGTTAGLGVFKGYALHESLQIYRQLRLRDVLQLIAHSAAVVPRTAFRCLAQRARWPWAEDRRYLRLPLHELRQQFGIRVHHGHTTSIDH